MITGSRISPTQHTTTNELSDEGSHLRNPVLAPDLVSVALMPECMTLMSSPDNQNSKRVILRQQNWMKYIIGQIALCRRPPHLQIPLSSRNIMNCSLHSFIPPDCASLIHKGSALVFSLSIIFIPVSLPPASDTPPSLLFKIPKNKSMYVVLKREGAL